MSIIKEIRHDIIQKMYEGRTSHVDMSDIGNEIGLAIGKYIDDQETLADFISGVKHGVSIINGTHGK